MNYLLLGAGMQGTAIAFDLLKQADDTRKVVAVDGDAEALKRLADRLGDRRLETVRGKIQDGELLASLAREADVMISAVNYWFNVALTELAIEHRCHFVDLGGNTTIVEKQFELDAAARDRGVTVVPGCDLASILAHDLQLPFSTVESLRIRVGGLPLHPLPPLNYQLVFAVQGLINQYIEPCVAIRDGAIKTVDPLTEIETLRFPEPYGELEAFQTSGGVGTLPETLLGRVQQLDYKTIRYPGHCEQFRLLMELGLTGSEPVVLGEGREVVPRQLLGRLLETHLAGEGEDAVLMLIETEGLLPTADGDAPTRRSLRIVDRADREKGITAMMRTTGYPAAIIARMLAGGEIDARGARRQELVVPADRLAAEMEARGFALERWDSDPARPSEV